MTKQTSDKLIIPTAKDEKTYIGLSVLDAEKNTFFLERECGEGMEVSGYTLFHILNKYQMENF